MLTACGNASSPASVEDATPAAEAGRTASTQTAESPAREPSPANVAASNIVQASSVAASSVAGNEPHNGNDEVPDPASLADPFVLPGPITADTEPDGLRRIYGAGNVKLADVPGAEGETAHGVILFPDDPSRRAYVYFQDDRKLTGLSMVSVVDQQSRWRTAQGIRMGMPLAKLVALNHGPFEFLGFDWDYSGQVTDWLGGRLDAPRGESSVRVQLAHGDIPKDVSYDKLPIGDRSFRSDHPQLARMKVFVAGMSANFPGRDDQ